CFASTKPVARHEAHRSQASGFEIHVIRPPQILPPGWGSRQIAVLSGGPRWALPHLTHIEDGRGRLGRIDSVPDKRFLESTIRSTNRNSMRLCIKTKFPVGVANAMLSPQGNCGMLCVSSFLCALCDPLRPLRHAFLLKLTLQIFCEAYSARDRSSIRSSGFSSPIDSRTVPSVMPAARNAVSSMR